MSSAHAVFDCEELLETILYSVTVRDLCRFKLISRTAKGIISNPRFIKEFCRRSSTKGIYYMNEPVSIKELPPSFDYITRTLDEGSTFEAKQESAGLFLCLVKTGNILDRFRIVIANPGRQTHRVITFPYMLNSSYAVDYHEPHLMLAYQPDISPSYYVWARNCSHPLRFAVFDSSEDRWRYGLLQGETEFGFPTSASVWNKSLVWVSRGEGDMDSLFEHSFAFLDKPVMRSAISGVILYSGTSGGSLFVVLRGFSEDFSQESMSILEWGALNIDWNPVYKVECSDLSMVLPQIKIIRKGKVIYKYTIMQIIKGKNRKDDVMVVSVPGVIAMYGFGSGVVTVLQVEASGKYALEQGVAFNPSLADI